MAQVDCFKKTQDSRLKKKRFLSENVVDPFDKFRASFLVVVFGF